MSEATISVLYREAIESVAAQLARELAERGLRAQPAWDRVEQVLPRFADPMQSAHAWIFRSPDTLHLSSNVEEALDERPDGRRDWLQGSLESAASAVARFDVCQRLIDLHDMECD